MGAEEQAKEDSASAATNTTADTAASTTANGGEGAKKSKPRKSRAEQEARAVAAATASADAAYLPSPSVLNAEGPEALMEQVDGVSLREYHGSDSIYVARAVPIPPKGKLEVPIHVTSAGSIVEYSMETKQYDLGFGIVAKREEGDTVVQETSRVESHVAAVTGRFLVGAVPCALVFTFDNEYSWMREKVVTYRIVVTPPSKDNVLAGRRRRSKQALKVVKEDKADAETTLGTASEKRLALQKQVEDLESQLKEKREALEAAEKEESVLQKRLGLRMAQEGLLQKRLTDGWDDEKEEEDEDGVVTTKTTNGKTE